MEGTVYQVVEETEVETTGSMNAGSSQGDVMHIAGDALVSGVEGNAQMDDSMEHATPYDPTDYLQFEQRHRSTWTEDRIQALLDLYINEHPAYLKAKAERQVTEFHDYIGQILNSDGIIVAGLLKNLGREYRKSWAKCKGVEPSDGLRLRRSRELCVKFERYYELYSRVGLRELRPSGMGPKRPAGSNHSNIRSNSIPKIKKLKKAPPPLAQSTILEQVMTPPQMMMPPPGGFMSDKNWKEYIDVMRTQNRALVEIGKELRLMRVGYFTEHELAIDA